jgi:hypothetical protein
MCRAERKRHAKQKLPDGRGELTKEDSLDFLACLDLVEFKGESCRFTLEFNQVEKSRDLVIKASPAAGRGRDTTIRRFCRSPQSEGTTSGSTTTRMVTLAQFEVMAEPHVPFDSGRSHSSLRRPKLLGEPPCAVQYAHLCCPQPWITW